MTHARDEHGLSNFDESSFILSLEEKYKSLELSTSTPPPHPNYQGFLAEQIIMQNIISKEDEWKRHIGNYFSEEKRDKVIQIKEDLVDEGVWSGGTGDISQYMNAELKKRELLEAQDLILVDQSKSNPLYPEETPTITTSSSITLFPLVIIGVIILAIVFLIHRRRA